MKRCCGAKYPDNYNYCPKCGKKLEIDFWGELFTKKDKNFFLLYSKDSESH